LGSTIADKFHARFNAGQYREISSESDEAFQKAAGGETSAIALFESLHRKLGKIKQAKAAGWHVNDYPSAFGVFQEIDETYDKILYFSPSAWDSAVNRSSAVMTELLAALL